MAEAKRLPLLSQYSDAFTRLHNGKRSCIEHGIDRIALNRFVVDAANSTSQPDVSTLLSMVDYDTVEGDDRAAKEQYCKTRLFELVAFQEEVNTLQNVAREKGIAGGLLNIVGQASIQSPEDHGASVIRQLSSLMDEGKADKSTAQTAESTVSEADKVPQVAANDAANESPDPPPPTGIAAWLTLAQQNWQALTVDVVFCLAASFFAISLVS